MCPPHHHPTCRVHMYTRHTGHMGHMHRTGLSFRTHTRLTMHFREMHQSQHQHQHQQRVPDRSLRRAASYVAAP